MFSRAMLLSYTVAAAFMLASFAPAQPPGKGPAGKFKGGPPGGDVKKLEEELHQLQKQVKEIEEKLAHAKEGFAKGKGGFGPKGFEMKFEKKVGGPKDFAKAKPPVGEKLGAATIKERYEHYKKLYDALPKSAGEKTAGAWKGRGKGGFGFGGPWRKGPDEASSIEARLDRLIREVDELRKEIRKKK
jgi:hypothetical protein